MMMYFVTVQASTQEYQNQIARLAVQYDMQHTRGDTKAIGGVFKYQYTGTNVHKAHAFIREFRKAQC